MNTLRLIVFLLAVANPFHAAALLAPGLLGPDRASRAKTVGIGAALAAAAAIVLAIVADEVLDALDVTSPTFRLGAGVVITATGVRSALIAPKPWSEGLRGGRLSMLVPVAFPVLFTPELAVAAVSYSADRGTSATVVAIAVAIAVFAALAVTGVGWRMAPAGAGEPGAAGGGGARRADPWLSAAGRVMGALAVVLGIALVVDGIFDV